MFSILHQSPIYVTSYNSKGEAKAVHCYKIVPKEETISCMFINLIENINIEKINSIEKII